MYLGRNKDSRMLLPLQARRFLNDATESLQVDCDNCDCTYHRRRCRFDDCVDFTGTFSSCVRAEGHH